MTQEKLIKLLIRHGLNPDESFSMVWGNFRNALTIYTKLKAINSKKK